MKNHKSSNEEEHYTRLGKYKKKGNGGFSKSFFSKLPSVSIYSAIRGLTGESDALLRTLECTNQENPLETDNLCFFGTLCKEGIGRGIVIQIGDNTIIGQIAHLASTAGTQKTPLRMEIDRFILIVIAFAFTCGAVFFIVGIIVGYKIIIDITFAIGVLVGTVPEGLLATVTAALTLTAKRLATKKVLVKNLEAVETLGSTSCICSDKTGTLTQNKMTVEHMWYDGTIKRGLNYQKFGPDYKYEYDLNSSGFKNLHENAMLCSEAVFDNTAPKPADQNAQEGEEERQKAYEKELAKIPWLNRPAIGDASETALIRFYQAIEDIKETRNKYPIRAMEDKSLAKIPFNSAWKYAVTICDYPTTNSENCIFIKGAPEKIWQLCSNILINDHVVAIDDHWRKQFQQVNRKFGEGGERVLGFAKLHLPKDKYPANYQFNCKNISNTNFPHEGFTFTGLISLIDPPREVVPFSILKCKTAGVKVIMVTGDQPVTAAAIARQVNIFQKDEKTVNQIAEEKNISFEKAFDQSDSIVIHGDMITQATQEDDLLPESHLILIFIILIPPLGEKGRTLAKWLSKPRIVFARTTPAQKLIIVKGCQAQGHIVAVTGDGVNDSPAIKKADIGIAMGVTGSDVAKDAADMILLTDDFSAIIIGIEEGRKIFDNLKKSIIYCTSINIPQLLPFLAFLIFGFPVPITPILMLCVDIGTDVIPAIAFAAEEAELGIMLRPPRRKTEHMVNSKLLTSAYGVAGLFEAMGGFLTYFIIMRDFGFPILELFNLVRHKGFYPNDNEVFDPNAPYYGNGSQLFQDYCNACWADASKCDTGKLGKDATDGTPDWIHNSDKTLDMRLFYLRCSNENGVKSIYSEVNFGSCLVKQVSEYSGAPVCYTSESVKFAQTAYFISIVFAQVSNAMSVKSRKFSFMFSGLTNFLLVYGFASEICLTLLLTFANPFHSAFNTRELTFLHYGIPAIPFSVLALFYNEIRKLLIRNAPSKNPRKPNWWIRNTYW